MWLPTAVPTRTATSGCSTIRSAQRWLPGAMLIHGADGGGYFFDQRITAKALRDIGPLAPDRRREQFTGAVMHEMVTQDGRKMSKHLGNVVDPDDLMGRVGADTTRLAVLDGARPALNWTEKPFRTARSSSAICGPSRRAAAGVGAAGGRRVDQRRPLRGALATWCRIARANTAAGSEGLEMHRAARNAMRLLRAPPGLRGARGRRSRRGARGCRPRGDRAALRLLVQVLAPLTPHVAEELGRRPGGLARQRGALAGEPFADQRANAS